MTAKDIQIETNKPKGGPYAYGSFEIQVAEEDPLDKLSRVFKKYTHTIKYTGGGDYISANHNIGVYTKPSGYREFEYQRPSVTVKHVEVFFRTDSGNNTPLILGFITQGSKYYYTWQHLKSRSNYYSFLSGDWINERDIITRLLEEVGLTVLDRKEKLVIRLDLQPSGGGGRNVLKYPDSGFFKGDKQITVTKVANMGGLRGYDKYEHTVPSTRGVSVQDFYVTYEKNSRYFKVYDTSGRGYGGLSKVTAYYENSTTGGRYNGTGINAVNSKRLVFITFSITGKSNTLYEYPYSLFVKELKTVTAAKNWDTDARIIIGHGGLKTINTRDESTLLPKLKGQSDRLKQITFVKDEPGSGLNNENIKIDEQEIKGQEGVAGQGNKFKKVDMKPDQRSGPFKVYNKHLFTLEKDKKIEGQSVLDSIVTSTSGKGYHSITVYYSPEVGSKYKALLVEFNDYDIKTYIKRLNEDGTKWAITNAEDFGIRDGTGDAELLPILQKEREKLRQLIEFLKGGPSSGRDGNKNIKTEEPSDLEGQSVVEGYKFQKVVMTPKTDDSKGGSSVGPWKVHNNDQLFTRESGMKIPEDVLNPYNIFTTDVASSTSSKYMSITVYYILKNESDYKALLVEFVRVGGTSTTSNNGIRDTGSETKIYFRRAMYDGSKWDDASGEDTSENNKLVQKLTRIAMSASIIEADSSSGSAEGADAATISGSVVGGIGGAGAGFAIYKYHGVLLSLIRR